MHIVANCSKIKKLADCARLILVDCQVEEEALVSQIQEMFDTFQCSNASFITPIVMVLTGVLL